MATSVQVLGLVVTLCVMMTFASMATKSIRLYMLSKERPSMKYIVSNGGQNQFSMGLKLSVAVRGVELQGAGEKAVKSCFGSCVRGAGECRGDRACHSQQ